LVEEVSIEQEVASSRGVVIYGKGRNQVPSRRAGNIMRRIDCTHMYL
jgi:hypothetical protein